MISSAIEPATFWLVAQNPTPRLLVQLQISVVSCEVLNCIYCVVRRKKLITAAKVVYFFKDEERCI
jgi:hypothetical protein